MKQLLTLLNEVVIMYIALNSKKQRIHIWDALKDDKYYCPVCNEEVIKRKGTINAHHFAHKNNSQCLEKDGWHYDMSDWHYDWQNQFPVENQEVVFKSDNSFICNEYRFRKIVCFKEIIICVYGYINYCYLRYGILRWRCCFIFCQKEFHKVF